AARPLDGTCAPDDRLGGFRGRLRAEHEHRLALRQIEAEDPGGGQVLDEIEAPRALLVVLEAPVPDRIVRVGAVRRGGGRRDPVVGPPRDAPRRRLGVETEGRVLAMERVRIATRQERAYAERPRAWRLTVEPPDEQHPRVPGLDEDLVLEACLAVDPERPAWP